MPELQAYHVPQDLPAVVAVDHPDLRHVPPRVAQKVLQPVLRVLFGKAVKVHLHRFSGFCHFHKVRPQKVRRTGFFFFLHYTANVPKAGLSGKKRDENGKPFCYNETKEMNALKVVDLRNVFGNCNDALIEISDSRIYYAEEKTEEGHNSLFLLEYNRITHRERIIANYFLTDPAFVQHFFSFPEDIVVVMESGESEAWILRIDKQTGEEKNFERMSFIGSFADCRALDETHVVFFTAENDRHRQLFREYKKLTGFSRVAYLYDLEDRRYYYIRDPRICNSDAAKLIPYDWNGERRLLVLQPHGSEEDKLKCFREMRWLGDNVNDNVWLCPLFDLVVSVKSGEELVPLELILSAGTSGLVRYAGMDDGHIYFRAKYYPTGDLRLCSYSKASGKKTVAARLNLGEDEPEAFYSIDPRGGHAYRIREGEDDCEVIGVLNSSVHARYPKDLGKFVTCVDDRFIVARYILSDEKDSFEFNSIIDAQTGSQKSYECSCIVSGSTVVLY